MCIRDRCGFDPKPVNDWIIAEDKPGYRYSSLFREYPLINYDVMPNPPISLKALEAFMLSLIHIFQKCCYVQMVLRISANP